MEEHISPKFQPSKLNYGELHTQCHILPRISTRRSNWRASSACSYTHDGRSADDLSNDWLRIRRWIRVWYRLWSRGLADDRRWFKWSGCDSPSYRRRRRRRWQRRWVWLLFTQFASLQQASRQRQRQRQRKRLFNAHSERCCGQFSAQIVSYVRSVDRYVVCNTTHTPPHLPRRPSTRWTRFRSIWSVQASNSTRRKSRKSSSSGSGSSF